MNNENDDEQLSPTVLVSDNDVGRLNQLFDMLTAKQFISPTVFTQAIRQALNLHGINLPLLEIEGTGGVPTIVPARDTDGDDDGDEDDGVDHPRIDDGYTAPPVDQEVVFLIHSMPPLEDMPEMDEDSGLYLYIVIDRNEKGLYDCYAQIVSADELADIMDDDVLEREFPEIVGDSDGETDYERQVRHTDSDESGDTTDDVDNGPPIS
jgi:hypothetical protein